MRLRCRGEASRSRRPWSKLTRNPYLLAARDPEACSCLLLGAWTTRRDPLYLLFAEMVGSGDARFLC